MTIKKILAASGIVAMFAGASVVGLAPAAQAAQQITVTPNANLKGGDKVTVSYTGFSPSAPVAVGVCPTPRINNIKGPGDCGRSKNGNSKLTTADASGKGSAEITIPKGPLENATPPAASCPPCSMGVTNIAKASETVNTKLNYAGAAVVKKKVADTGSDASGKAPEEALPQTGPRETLIVALIGFALLQLGLVFAVRANRASPRRNAV